jgi:flagellar basal body-associated protein FliL
MIRSEIKSCIGAGNMNEMCCDFSERKTIAIGRYLPVYIILGAIVILNVLLTCAMPCMSAERYVSNNAEVVESFSIGKGDDAALQHMSTLQGPRYQYEHFKEFAIPVYNETGKCRVLLCDIVLELNDGITISKERQRLRKLLYKTSRSLGHGVDDIRSMKQQLCDRIKHDVNEAVVKEAVKDVQMTRFLLL